MGPQSELENDMGIPEMPTEGQADQSRTAESGAEEQSTNQHANLQQQQQVQQNQEALNTPDFNIGGDFDNVEVDTAGDALASYGNDDDLNLDDMEGSAFGDAFHPDDEELS